jgi:TonB-dependent starch-binding outer membrane protein SusC
MRVVGVVDFFTGENRQHIFTSENKNFVVMRKILLFICFLFASALLFAQEETTVQGKVTDADNMGIPGVSVVIEGTTSGTITDIDGNYNIETPSGANLVFSFVGLETITVAVDNRTLINVQMSESTIGLDEVVVVGYGQQSVKDLTSSITTVKSDEITKTPSSQPMQALQGKVAGLQVVSNGAPGGSPTIRVRGVGSFQGNAAPLYVVDGMFFDNIDFLNTSDIESISVLKDASAAAIYGVRAANGVVLIETKSGNYNQATEIIYDGYYGFQTAQNVLKMANAEQFTRYISETGSTADASYLSNAITRYGSNPANPDVPNVNTDWYDEVLKSSSPVQSHSLSINGGSGRARYSIGASYFDQEGLLTEARNEYERVNFRSKLDFKATDWLNAGGNVNISNATQYNAEDAVWFKTYFAVPILPVYDELNTGASPEKLSNARNLGYRESQNPFYDLLYYDNRNQIGKILGNFYLDFKLIPDKLSFKTTYNYSYGNVNERNVDFEFNDGEELHQSAIRKSHVTSYNQIWDNILTYTQNFNLHKLTVLAGYSYRSEKNDGFFASGTELDPSPSWDNEELWYLYYANSINADGTGDRDPDDPYKYAKNEYGNSYFGRIAYNYDDRYLIYGTLRRDGTNKFQKKWGNFPTVGAGWVLSEEGFFNVGFVDFLKLRGSWGKLGNDGVASAIGASTLVPVTTAINDKLVAGNTVDNIYDYLDQWETTAETNVGLTSRLFGNRLSVEADYYIRNTKNAAVTIILPLVRENVRRNKGEIRNSGFELTLNWSDNITNDLSYRIGGNMATLKNEVKSLGGPQYLDAGQAEFRQRSIIGEPVEAFFGYDVTGVFQDETQIANSGLTAQFIGDNNLVPGDFIYKDQNSDGVIDDLDRVVLGSYLPDLTYGFNIGITYKNLDLTANFQGQSGHSILNRKRGEIIFTDDTNIDADLANNLWRGEGTSNKYPSAAGLRKSYNQAMSSYFVEDGSYFRIQNVRLSYNLKKNKLFGIDMPDARITLTAERPLTIFDYNGFNPEVANGIDRQTYPIPAVYTIGINLKL